MGKNRLVFHCSHCDAQFPKWAGRCVECGKWGTVEEANDASQPATAKAHHAAALDTVAAAKPRAFSDMKEGAAKRMSTGLPEVDRVLGGGLVPGSLTLLGGDPGIGKSTLIAQVAASMKQAVLYVSGEESGEQIKMRLDRLGLEQSQIQFLGEEHVEVICKTAMEQQPGLLIIDSIQTVASSAVDSEPGSVTQIKASTIRFLEVAKSSGIPIVLIGHVTKGGEIGGPKALEHIVDTVLYLEGDRQHHFRLLRGVKNRFGSTNEIGVFDMQEGGMQTVANPSEQFLAQRSTAPGTCVTAVMEGNRTFLVEVQALVSKTSFGYPQRKSSGFDLNRLNVLIAVLQKRLDAPLDTHDVYVNVVGGVKFGEPAMDLAVCIALLSSLEDVSISEKAVIWGEVGLAGEVRSVGRQKEREKEAKQFGLTDIISPSNSKTLTDAIAAAHLK